MSQNTSLAPRPLFPRWMNLLLPLAIIGGLGAAAYVPVVVYLGASPMATDVGYAPDQPIPYSHALHVGQLGLDCRYCHTTVTEAGFAAIPSAQTCMNCHSYIRVTNPDGTSNKKMEPLLDAWDANWRTRGATYTQPPTDQPRVEGKPVEWVKIHDLPDYSYFNHAAHVTKGVSCVTCHGRVDQMEVVYQSKPLNMAWCLDCHREPEKFLRPADQVTNLSWTIEQLDTTNKAEADAIRAENSLAADATITQEQLGTFLKKKMAIKDHQYMTSCSTCHR
jgi:menaquinone reductase, multiheme cytochrome c subunit